MMGFISRAFLSGMKFGKTPRRVFGEQLGSEMEKPFNRKNMALVQKFAKRYDNKNLEKTARLWLAGDKRFEPLIIDELWRMHGRFQWGKATTITGAVGGGYAGVGYAALNRKK